MTAVWVLIKLFPIELIRKIRFYTLRRQNKNLLRDIIHFKTSLEIIKKTLPIYPMNGAPHLLLNDLWIIVKQINEIQTPPSETPPSEPPCHAPRCPYHPNHMNSYYQIWLRMFRLHKIKSVERWIRSCYALKPTKIQIRLVWAIFTPEEREEFISWQKKTRGFIV